MAHWSGLGYYSRARNLHRCAKRVVAEYGGVFPADPALLADLPGIGRSTAAAISAFAYGTRAAILDGNVKRVFAGCSASTASRAPSRSRTQLWRRAEALLPQDDMQSYTQGLMDLGATLCTRSRPDCQRCPLAHRCVAFATGRTAELPVSKPKKAVPERHSAMLVIVDDGQVLLEQRPGSGIWGGLLSLPEVALDDWEKRMIGRGRAFRRAGSRMKSCSPSAMASPTSSCMSRPIASSVAAPCDGGRGRPCLVSGRTGWRRRRCRRR